MPQSLQSIAVDEATQPSGRAKGGVARANVLSADERHEIARLASQTRWAKPRQKNEKVSVTVRLNNTMIQFLDNQVKTGLFENRRDVVIFAVRRMILNRMVE